MSEYFALEQWVAAQQSVIGSMLLDKGWVPEVLAQTRAEDYTQPYRALYLAIQQLTQDGTAIDAVTVLHALDGDAAENRKLVLDLLDLTPTAANCKAYVDILLEQSQLSRLRGLGLALAECQTSDAAREAAASIGEALAVRSNQETFTQQDLLGRFYERHDAQKAVKYLPWGLKKLDMRLYAELGDFVILGGYPSPTARLPWHCPSPGHRVSSIGWGSSRLRLVRTSCSTGRCPWCAVCPWSASSGTSSATRTGRPWPTTGRRCMTGTWIFCLRQAEPPPRS